MNRPLLFIPGWGMGASVFTPTIDAFGAAHTRSIELPESGHTLTDWAQQIATTLTPNTVLCGWSLGGMLALELALELAQQRPDTIAALVLISTTPRFIADEHWPHGVTPQAFQAFEHLLQNDPPALLRQFITLQSMGDPHPRALARRLAEHPSPSSHLATGLSILRDTDLRASIPRITQPTLLIQGEADHITAPGACHWLQQHLPHARSHLINHAAHALPMSHPQETAHAMRAFFADLP